MTSLKERTKWAITHVVKTRNLSNKKVAQLLKINENTLGSYRNMGAEPKVDFIVKFCDEFDFDILWFTKGIGEPFSGARIIFPEMCGLAYVQKRLGSLESRESELIYETVGGEDIKGLEAGLSTNMTALLKAVSEFFHQQSQQEKIISGKISKLQDRLENIELRLKGIETKNR
jgi:transcriptional regulator with XRE-family HTH domain